jgi:hypothetical protein
MMMTHGQASDPSHVKPNWRDAILHARIAMGGTELSGSDIPNAEPMRSAYLTVPTANTTGGGRGRRIAPAFRGLMRLFAPWQWRGTKIQAATGGVHRSLRVGEREVAQLSLGTNCRGDSYNSGGAPLVAVVKAANLRYGHDGSKFR